MIFHIIHIVPWIKNLASLSYKQQTNQIESKNEFYQKIHTVQKSNITENNFRFII